MSTPPPWLDAARRAALRRGAAGETAAREIRRWDRLDRYGAAVADALDGATPYVVEPRGLTPSGAAAEADGIPLEVGRGWIRAAVEAVELGDGQVVTVDGARGLRDDWLADPERSAARVRGCRRTWCVAAGPGGRSAIPLTCGDTVCPYCTVQRTAPRRSGLAAALRAYRAAGCTVVMLTRTRRACSGDGLVVWTDADRARWGPCPHPTAAAAGYTAGAAVPGETLSEAWGELAAASRAMIDGRAMVKWGGAEVERRAWWRDTVLAHVDAIEATQVRTRWSGKGPDRRRVVDALRWHVHGHQIVILAPGVVGPRDVRSEVVRSHRDGRGGRRRRVLAGSCAWWRTWRRAWASEIDAADAAQHAIVIDDDDQALAEVLKYPGKLAEMTTAGVVEWLASAKGRRPQRCAGALHRSTSLGVTAAAAAALRWRACAEGTAEDEVAAEALGALRRRLAGAGVDVDALQDAELPDVAIQRWRLAPRYVTIAADAWLAWWLDDRRRAGGGGRVVAVDDDTSGARVALTVERLDRLIAQGVRAIGAWDLASGAPVILPPLVDLRREIRSWRSTTADPPR